MKSQIYLRYETLNIKHTNQVLSHSIHLILMHIMKLANTVLAILRQLKYKNMKL